MQVPQQAENDHIHSSLANHDIAIEHKKVGGKQQAWPSLNSEILQAAEFFQGGHKKHMETTLPSSFDTPQ